jgi:hypothetical protein
VGALAVRQLFLTLRPPLVNLATSIVQCSYTVQCSIPCSSALSLPLLLPLHTVPVSFSLQASCYLNKLPPSFTAEDRILVSDPMLATGVCSRTARPHSCRNVQPSQHTHMCVWLLWGGFCVPALHLLSVYHDSICCAIVRCRWHADASAGRHCGARRVTQHDSRDQVLSSASPSLCQISTPCRGWDWLAF